MFRNDVKSKENTNTNTIENKWGSMHFKFLSLPNPFSYYETIIFP